jgi:hypothetical protein
MVRRYSSPALSKKMKGNACACTVVVTNAMRRSKRIRVTIEKVLK